MQKEIWRSVPGFKGYAVSNYGDVESSRSSNMRMLIPSKTRQGFLTVSLYYGSSGRVQKFAVHRLVAIAFLGLNPTDSKTIVKHRNGDKTNNALWNLEISEKAYEKKPNATSQYKGVNWNKRAGKWQVRIRQNGKTVSLGYFSDESEAAQVYLRWTSPVLK